jgi:hypothetical protein
VAGVGTTRGRNASSVLTDESNRARAHARRPPLATRGVFRARRRLRRLPSHARTCGARRAKRCARRPRGSVRDAAYVTNAVDCAARERSLVVGRASPRGASPRAFDGASHARSTARRRTLARLRARGARAHGGTPRRDRRKSRASPERRCCARRSDFS